MRTMTTQQVAEKFGCTPEQVQALPDLHPTSNGEYTQAGVVDYVERHTTR